MLPHPCLLEGFLSALLTEDEIWSLPDRVADRTGPHKKIVCGGVCCTIFLPRDNDSFSFRLFYGVNFS